MRTTAELQAFLASAALELSCPACRNAGYVWTGYDEKDECPACHGDKRNPATVALLTVLTAHVIDIAKAVD